MIFLNIFIFFSRKWGLSKLKIPTPRLQFPDNTRNKTDDSIFICVILFVCRIALYELIFGKKKKKKKPPKKPAFCISFTKLGELWDEQLILSGLNVFVAVVCALCKIHYEIFFFFFFVLIMSKFRCICVFCWKQQDLRNISMNHTDHD